MASARHSNRGDNEEAVEIHEDFSRNSTKCKAQQTARIAAYAVQAASIVIKSNTITSCA